MAEPDDPRVDHPGGGPFDRGGRVPVQSGVGEPAQRLVQHERRDRTPFGLVGVEQRLARTVLAASPTRNTRPSRNRSGGVPRGRHGSVPTTSTSRSGTPAAVRNSTSSSASPSSPGPPTPMPSAAHVRVA
ncbi:hypothetical protein [Actinosynnema sp. NPDC020468]|uniref:hypothetical protein n=1 Tax=Actinosynnema sp. NPDC020468 TaxID=3154488 RepID=UPI0033CC5F27